MSSGSSEYWKQKRIERENRKYFNEEILEEIAKFLEANPDQRFCQALVNLGIIDCSELYHKESHVILHMIKQKKEKAE